MQKVQGKVRNLIFNKLSSGLGQLEKLYCRAVVPNLLEEGHDEGHHEEERFSYSRARAEDLGQHLAQQDVA